jgi:hypothetical protein
MNGVNKSKKEPLGKVLVKVIGKETVSKMQSSVMVLDVQPLANPSSVTISALKQLANFLFSKTISKGVRIILFLVISQLVHRLIVSTVSTPVDCGVKLSRHDKGKVVDVTLYKSLVGSLRYLTCTRPDILYAVGLVSWYMEEPRSTHWKTIK